MATSVIDLPRLFSFNAGRVDYDEETNKCTPNPLKGKISITPSEDSPGWYSFKWAEREPSSSSSGSPPAANAATNTTTTTTSATTSAQNETNNDNDNDNDNENDEDDEDGGEEAGE